MDCIAKPSEPPLILVVDDDRFMRYQLHHIMSEEGYRVEEANNGREGIEAYQTLKPDIVLMDAIMPVMDGFSCCQKLRSTAIEQTQPGQAPIHPPILMITSLDDQQSVDMAFASGADDYVTKPIHWAVLRQRVKRLIYQHQLHRELHDANQKLAEANFALERLVSLDGLTQVANRRRFDQCFQFEWQRLARDQQYLSLILADIDYFKAYNDTYGHQAGDRCLYQVAQAIQQATK
ncbi:MAG TPA: response regulator, partial [Chroococcidiopsis sp.]